MHDKVLLLYLTVAYSTEVGRKKTGKYVNGPWPQVSSDVAAMRATCLSVEIIFAAASHEIKLI